MGARYHTHLEATVLILEERGTSKFPRGEEPQAEVILGFPREITFVSTVCLSRL